MFDITDAARDTIRRGAFARTLAARAEPWSLLWQHRPAQRIGTRGGWCEPRAGGGGDPAIRRAEHLGSGRWLLSGLLRGRGGTEALVGSELPAGAPFALIDDRLVRLDGALDGADTLAALGLADAEPVTATIIARGRMLAPLSPVHPRWTTLPDGCVEMRWTRRARGAWNWPETMEIPLYEQAESYRIGVGDPLSPQMWWQTGESRFSLSSTEWADLAANHAGSRLWVQQIGSHGLSPPLHLMTI